MQIQEDRRQAHSPSETKSNHRENSLGFFRPSADASFDLFAEIFQTFAAAAPSGSDRPVAHTDGASDHRSLDQSNAVRKYDQDRDDEATREDPYADSIAPYDLPGIIHPPLVEDSVELAAVEVDAATVADQPAPPTTAPTVQESFSATQTPNLTEATALVDKPITEIGSEFVATNQADPELLAPDDSQVVISELTGTETATAAVSQSEPLTASTHEVRQVSDDAVVADLVTQRAASQDAAAETSVASKPETVLATEAGDRSGQDRSDQSERHSSHQGRADRTSRSDTPREGQDDRAQRLPTSSATEARSASTESGSSLGPPSMSTVERHSPGSASAAIPLATASVSAAAAAKNAAAGPQALGTPGVASIGGLNSAGSSSTIPNRAAAADSDRSGEAQVADRARLVHRIAKAFQRIGVDGGQVRLKMHPEELGGVQLELNVSGRRVSARVIADNEHARQLLQDNLPELRQRLETQGLIVERLEVQRRTDSGGSELANQNHQQNGTGSGQESDQQTALWRRQPAVNSGKNEPSAPAVELTRSVGSFHSDRALDLKG